jgi:DNA-binding transcriptional MerR regulator
MSTDANFTIGELAARAGLTPDALRYYERLGVIPKAPRTAVIEDLHGTTK